MLPLEVIQNRFLIDSRKGDMVKNSECEFVYAIVLNFFRRVIIPCIVTPKWNVNLAWFSSLLRRKSGRVSFLTFDVDFVSKKLLLLEKIDARNFKRPVHRTFIYTCSRKNAALRNCFSRHQKRPEWAYHNFRIRNTNSKKWVGMNDARCSSQIEKVLRFEFLFLPNALYDVWGSWYYVCDVITVLFWAMSRNANI